MMLSKSQVDRVGQKLKSGDVDGGVIETLEKYRGEFSGAYKAVETLLRDRLGYQVTGRPAKSTVAITEKLRRQSIRLSQIQDIAGCRIIVPTVVAQDSLSHSLSVFFDHIVMDDKRELPTNGYRALHAIPKIAGRSIEIQIRTELQHVWADISERLADIHGQDVKYGKGAGHVVQFLSRFSAAVAKFEAVGRRNLEFNRIGSGAEIGGYLKLKKKERKRHADALRMASNNIKLIINEARGYLVK
ncbi:hypothetical protein ACNPMX_18520 [Stenotrophomonas maltophilia]